MAGPLETGDLIIRILSETDDVILGVSRVINVLGDLNNQVEVNQKGLGVLGVAFGNLLSKIGYNILQAPIRAFHTLSRKVKEFTEFAKGATLLSARIEVQWRTLALTAGNAGQKIDDMSKHVNALRAYGIKTGEALESVSQFLATGLPVENISELARRAQDMAVVIGRDSTEAFQRFNLFLQTGNSEWIRTMGLTKTATQMTKEYATAQGLVVEALTDRQRKEALVQGLMKATIAYEGAYEEALKDPYKRWTSLPRLIENATEVLGHMFVPLMGTAVDMASTLLEKFEGIFRVTKKGAYRMMADELGVAAESLTKADKAAAIDKYFGQWTEFAYNVRASVELAAEGINEAFQNLVGKASGWGEGMGTNLTEGLLNAAQNIILPAIVQITEWIANFLAPGSAPKEGPLSTIDKWGTALMRSYMEGWTKIDFQVFGQVASTIQAAIQAAFTAAGGGDKAGLLQQLISGRQLAGQITGGMGDMEALGAQLRSITGALYEDLARYIQLVQQYRAATAAVTAARQRLAAVEAWVAEAMGKVVEAQKRVAAVQEWVAEASKKVEEIRRRNAKLEAQWAEIPERFTRGRKRQLQAELEAAQEEERRRREQLDAARKAVEAAQAEVEARRGAVEAARAQVEAAEAYTRQVQEAMSLQQARLQELQKMMEMESQLAKEKAVAQTEEIDAVEKIKNAWEGVFDPAKLEEAKERMRGLLAPLMPQVREIGDNFKRIWEGIKTLPGRVMDFIESLKKIKNDWWDPLPDWLKKILLGTIVLNFATHGAAGQALSTLISGAFTAAGLIPGVGWAIAAGALSLYITIKPFLSEEVRQEWSNAWDSLMGKGGDPLAAIGQAAETTLEHTPLMSSLLAWVDSLGQDVAPDMEEAADKAIAEPLINAAERASGEVVGTSILPDMVASILEWLSNLVEDMRTLMELLYETMVVPFNEIAESWNTNLDDITGRVETLTAKISILAEGIVGLPPLPEDLTRFSNGKLQVVTVNLQGSTFGSGLTEGDVRDWMYDAVGGLIE